MIKSYPKILPLVGKYADLVLNRRVEITEKCDGSMFAFGLDCNDKLHMRSKGQAIDCEHAPDLFRPAAEHVLSIQHKLEKNTAYYGETLKTPRHNTLAYDRVPTNHIALFGVFDFERTKGVDYEGVVEAAHHLEVDVVPLLGHVELGELQQFADMLAKAGKSWLGGADMEGIVVKDYTRPMEFAGMIYPLTVLKYVSEAFKEKHSSNPDYVPQRDKMDELFARYKTEARWNKAIQHLKEADKLTGEPKDIGPLMAELWKDVVEEEKENFKEELFHMFKKRLAWSVQAGFPEFYKQKLLQS